MQRNQGFDLTGEVGVSRRGGARDGLKADAADPSLAGFDAPQAEAGRVKLQALRDKTGDRLAGQDRVVAKETPHAGFGQKAVEPIEIRPCHGDERQARAAETRLHAGGGAGHCSTIRHDPFRLRCRRRT